MYKLRNKRNHGITLIALVITVKNSYVKGNKCVGGIVGFLRDKIYNCNNINSEIIESNYVGGILGYANKSVELNNCINNGTVYGKGNVRGLIGNKTSTIINCTDNETVNIE